MEYAYLPTYLFVFIYFYLHKSRSSSTICWLEQTKKFFWVNFLNSGGFKHPKFEKKKTYRILSSLQNPTNISLKQFRIPWRSREQNQQNQPWTSFQILSLSIHWNGHPARQCFLCHGNNWINGKTEGIELPITDLIYNILTQWHASRSLKFISSFRLLL